MNPEIVNAVFTTENGGHYKNFGINPISAIIYGKQEKDIIQVEVSIHENQEKVPPNSKNMEADYWGWWDETQKRFSLIWPQYFLLNMCFPYGIKAAEESNQGKAYRLNVNPIIQK